MSYPTMMRMLLVVVVVVAGWSSGASTAPPLPAWPKLWVGNWSMVNSTNGELLQEGGWYYDTESLPGLLRQENRIGCKAPNECAAIFRGGNVYFWTSSSSCCVQSKDVAPSPPDWLQTSVTYAGEGEFKYAPSIRCTVWKRPSTGETYYQSVEGALPIALDGGGTAIVWRNFNPSKPSAAQFALPGECTKPCSGFA